MPTSTLHDAEVESRWEAAPTILLVIAIQVSITIVSLQQGWSLWRLPWWSWLVLAIPEAILVVPLAAAWPGFSFDLMFGRRRRISLALIFIIGFGNGIALFLLITALLTGRETNGAELRLFEVDPDALAALAEPAGGTIVADAADKPHGWREAFLADPDGYVWAVGRPI